MSKKNLKKIIVIDLETTCWEPPEYQEDQKQDIIEVGLTLLDVKTLEVDGPHSILVHPERSTVSKFCTKLTTITPEMVKLENGAYPFHHVLHMLKDYDVKNTTWASYGDFDRKMFERQCREMDFGYPFGPRHINVKSLLALMMGWDNEVGMTKAFELIGETPIGTHHRGGDDAYNIAQLLAFIIRMFHVGYAYEQLDPDTDNFGREIK